MNQENPVFDIAVDRSEVATLKFDADSMSSVFGRSDLWPSWVADMDFPASQSIRDALARRVAHGVYGYENYRAELPAAVAAWYARRHHWPFDPQHLVFSPRTLASISALISLFSGEGQGVIVQSPVFYDFKLIIRQTGRRLVKNPLKLENGEYRMDFDQLETVAANPNNTLLILCNPHNPIGRVWSKSELSELARICAANGVYVIADEIHGDITYRDHYTPLASVSEAAAGNSATCLSPVKAFNLAGVANSMIVIDDEDRRARCRNRFGRLQVNKNNVFASSAMMAAYTDSEVWLDAVLHYLHENVRALSCFLGERVPGVRLVEPGGTYLVWLDFRALELDVGQLEKFLVEDARIAGNPGHWFGREGAGFARINIACPRSVMLKALENLETAVKRLDRSSDGKGC